MPNIRGPELLILVLVIVILFGAKRLPDAARSVGRSLRIFKAETRGLTGDEQADAAAGVDAPQPSDVAESGSASPKPVSDATDAHQNPPSAPQPPRHQA